MRILQTTLEVTWSEPGLKVQMKLKCTVSCWIQVPTPQFFLLQWLSWDVLQLRHLHCFEMHKVTQYHCMACEMLRFIWWTCRDVLRLSRSQWRWVIRFLSQSCALDVYLNQVGVLMVGNKLSHMVQCPFQLRCSRGAWHREVGLGQSKKSPQSWNHFAASEMCVLKFSMSWLTCVLVGTLVPKGLVQENILQIAFKIQCFLVQRCQGENFEQHWSNMRSNGWWWSFVNHWIWSLTFLLNFTVLMEADLLWQWLQQQSIHHMSWAFDCWMTMRTLSQHYRLNRGHMLMLQHHLRLRTKLLVLTLMLNPMMQVRTFKVSWLFLQNVVITWLSMELNFIGKQLSRLREACAFYNLSHLSQSGSKTRCFERLWEHQKRLELQIVLAAARETEAEQQRQPNSQKLAEPPDEKTQQLHNSTHLPYQEWCPHCVAFRARPDRHQRDGSVKDSGIPTVSFDFAYTKAVEPGGQAQETSAVIALVLVDSSTNFTGCVPISKKNDFDVMVREILQFSQTLGHGECNFFCDNEPSIMQVQKE